MSNLAEINTHFERVRERERERERQRGTVAKKKFLFPEMRVMRKIFTRAAANYFS